MLEHETLDYTQIEQIKAEHLARREADRASDRDAVAA